jgi:hypothetical protein
VKVWEAIFVTLIGAALADQPPPAQLTEDQRKAQELLKKTVEERQRASAQAQTNVAPRLTQAEMEQQYIAGRITARQFQQYLRQQPATRPQLSPEKQAEALNLLRALTGKTNTPPPAGVGKAAPAAKSETPTPGEPATPAIVDVESKIRELEKLKEAREKASGTNAPAASVPKTKREKLDALLKQFVEGKISEADYKAQRAKLIAEPD